MTDTAIQIPDHVVMQVPAQPKRLGELLKLACKLLADLPQPRYVTIYCASQEINFGFGSDPAALTALTRWGSHYGEPITGERSIDSDGNETVRCTVRIPYHDGVTVEAYAYIRPEPATT